jgi:protein MAK16
MKASVLDSMSYVTIDVPPGVLYLYMKTIERAHTPANMWEKVELSKDYSKALEQVN